MKKGAKRLLGLLFVLILSFVILTLIDIPSVSAIGPTPTFTPIPPTPTYTPVPPTPTFTPIPPTPTYTPIPPTNTPTSTSLPATATTVPTADLSPANNNWIYVGEESGANVRMDLVPLPAPHSWEILLSDGIQLKLSAPIQICHPFRGGQFGWTGAVYLRSGSGWLEIPSTTDWTPDEEGGILICATAPMSGTYAVFGYAEHYEPVVRETVVPRDTDLPQLFKSQAYNFRME